ncbi:MAG: LysR family transcriptional regulator [Gammaproteobacteria bacterium]|nr:LysR family transcriptional regulator [Gammaproteobacteria bacterium]
MDLNAVRIFVAVLQAGSLTQASERLKIPIATLSRKISELEKQLNRQLFDRGKTGVKPTAQGQQLYEQVHLDIDNLLNTERHLTQDNQQISGILRISTMIGFDKIWDLLGEFQQRYPQVQVYCQATDRVVDLVADGIDVAFRTGALHTEAVIARPVFDISPVWVASPTLLAKLGTPTKFDDLTRYPLAGFARLEQSYLLFETDKTTFKLPCVFGSNDNAAVLHLAKSGQVMALIPVYTAQQYIASGQLVQVLADYPSKAYQVHALYLPHRHQSAVVKAFIEFLESV